MEILNIPNLLIIAGTGRNSGKTTLACEIIRKFSNQFPLVAIKISAHFHENITCGPVINNSDDLYIAEETALTGEKDSSRMLAAGARKSYFVMAADNQLVLALLTIQNLINANDYIICESGGLRKWVLPSIFLMLNNATSQSSKDNTRYLKPLCDHWITSRENETDFDLNTLTIANKRWQITK